MTDPTEPTSAMSTPPERYADDAHRYRLDSRIATGGMGEVWRATDTTLGRTVAVKVLKAEYADDPTFRGRFETEARNAAALHHPNVAGIFDFGQASPADGSASPRPYLVMELVEGQPLSALLRPGQPMEPAVAVDLMSQAAEAIGAAHRAGIVHRDVKPANLLVTRERTLKITDFGIARAADGVALTQTGMVMGTPQYISPEQAQGMSAGPESDVYSLGVVAFECLAGRRPFVADTAVATALAHLRDPVPELPDNVPTALAGVVRRSLAKKPAERFPDGTAFARALRNPTSVTGAVAAAGMPAGDDAGTQVLTGVGRPTPAPAPPPVVPVPVPDEEPEEPKRRSPLPWIAGVLALLLVAVLVWLAVAMGGDDDEDPAETPSTTATSAPTTEETTPPETSSEPTSEEPTTEETSEAPSTFSIDESDYLGNPIGSVEAQLRQLGLEPRTVEETNDGSEQEGRVTSVSPTNDLEDGDSVTVTYAGPAPEPEPTEEPTEEPTDPASTTTGTQGP